MTLIRLGVKGGNIHERERYWIPVHDLSDEPIDLSPERALLQAVRDLGGERVQESSHSSHNKSYGD